jgi:hypothetical protein
VIDDPWNDELVQIAARLEAKTKQKRWTERTGHLIERDVVVSAYAMRKLIASGEASEGSGERQIPVRRFDLIGRPPVTSDEIAESYDFQNGRRTALSVVELCREILHSGVFAFCCGETDDLFDGIYVSSDRHKNDYVHLILVSDFVALCSDIGTGGAQPR